MLHAQICMDVTLNVCTLTAIFDHNDITNKIIPHVQKYINYYFIYTFYIFELN